MSVDGARLVFVAGLHRSGTTPLARLMADNPQISGLTRTGVREDEGQHVQSVYPPARTFGGPGRFAWNPQAHLTEASPLVSEQNAARLTAAWSPYWDLGRPLLLEKSPPNLVMGRFLQALFPGSAFVVVLRHPVVVALSTKKWAPRTSLHRLVAHWFAAHELMLADLPKMQRTHVLRYEDLIADPVAELEPVRHLLGLAEPLNSGMLEVSRSSAYEKEWDALTAGSLVARRRRRRIEAEFADQCARFGYDVSDLRRREPWRWAEAAAGA